MPHPNGRKPPAPPPHSSSGKGACSLTMFMIPFVVPFLLVRAAVRKVRRGRATA